MNKLQASHDRTSKNPAHPDTRKKGRLLLIIIPAVIALVLTGAGIIYYTRYLASFQKVVLTVDNRVNRMEYLLKRARMTGDDPSLILQQLAYEQMVRILAPQYGITVSPSNIDEALREEANIAANGEVTEAGFPDWYAGRLEATGLSDAEYREMAGTNLLAVRLLEKLAADIPASAAQIHLYTIVTATLEDAQDARLRIGRGESFASLAGEISLDSQTKFKGGELGWIPRGVTPYDEVIFQLPDGQVSEPLAIDPGSSSGQYVIFIVVEKDSDRMIDAGPRAFLRTSALYNLINQQIPRHVTYSYTPEDNEWVKEQLAKDPGN